MLITPQDVRKILEEGDSLTDEVVQTYLTSAQAIVTSVLAGVPFTESYIDQIILWLTGHLIVTTLQRQATLEKAGSVEIRYSSAGLDQNLKATMYGQTVLLLDTSGRFLKQSQGGTDLRIFVPKEG